MIGGSNFCSPAYIIQKPKLFAAYKMYKNTFRAISSDGVRFKVYTRKNNPYGSADMWIKSIDTYLGRLGYKRISTKKITSKNASGIFSEYVFIHYGKKYIYGQSLFTDKNHIYIIEVGGFEQEYKKRKKDILSAIKTFAID